MKNISTLSNRLFLSLSLAIASTLVANVVRAEFQPIDRFAVDELSQKIATIIDLDPDGQSLIIAALNRAIASKETADESADNVTPPVNQPLMIQGKIAKPSPKKSIEACEDVAPPDVKKSTQSSPSPQIEPPPQIRHVFIGARG
jgi:hypothetical protein